MDTGPAVTIFASQSAKKPVQSSLPATLLALRYTWKVLIGTVCSKACPKLELNHICILTKICDVMSKRDLSTVSTLIVKITRWPCPETPTVLERWQG